MLQAIHIYISHKAKHKYKARHKCCVMLHVRTNAYFLSFVCVCVCLCALVLSYSLICREVPQEFLVHMSSPSARRTISVPSTPTQHTG